MEESKLEGISKEWLSDYQAGFLQLASMMFRLKLCTTPAYWYLRHGIETRVQNLSNQHVSKGKGY